MTPTVSVRCALVVILPLLGCTQARFRAPQLQEALPATANTESYAHRTDNPFLPARDNPLSTFAVDVDTASYSNVRRFLRDRRLPPADAVRVEEFINYFHYRAPAVGGEHPVALNTEVGPCPWQPAHRLVRLHLAAQVLPRAQVPPRNLTFLIDVSGSMLDANKLPLLQRAFAALVEGLEERDRVSIVTYAGRDAVALPPTSGADKKTILAALEDLQASGSTYGEGGIRRAYEVNRRTRIEGASNRVILATDGDFNVGQTSEGELVRLIEQQRAQGIALTVLGFGMGNLKDATLESLADHGDGNYAYIDSFAEARRVLVEDVAGTLITVAKDVKVQVELNPAVVASYRLIGYENRLLRREGFADDQTDAGDMGAGQNVTALYEIVPAAGAASQAALLRYQEAPALAGAAGSGELLTVKIRYKPRAATQSRLFETVVRDDGRALPATSGEFRFAAAVASFGMALRGGPLGAGATFGLARSLALTARADADEPRREFVTLVDTAAELSEKSR